MRNQNPSFNARRARLRRMGVGLALGLAPTRLGWTQENPPGAATAAGPDATASGATPAASATAPAAGATAPAAGAMTPTTSSEAPSAATEPTAVASPAIGRTPPAAAGPDPRWPTTDEPSAVPSPAPPPATRPEADPAEEHPSRIQLAAELGFLVALHHTVQFSQDGTRIDYVDEAGQDVLFPFGRLSAVVRLRERTAVTLLYQPLKLVTQEVASRDLVVDDEVFAAGTPMAFTYGFPFWRAGVARDVLRAPRRALWLGAALQIRDATIEFATLDGTQLVSRRNVGPVPLLSAKGRTAFRCGAFFEAEVDGFYAPIKYINGADTDVEGAILDLSVRAGIPTGKAGEAFLNLRYLGGGASSTGNDDSAGDGYTRNWLHFLTLSLGGRLNGF
ncbi:MAG: hypothetical protein JW751_08255 [Polyangiaceae bacterium]|nr:hypothetical protein [Polyangiaceae bacterium]